MIAANIPFKFSNGSTMHNRFMLAPLTNTQSHEDGTLSEEEFHWLTMRAKGGFGMVMTCASHVQKIGKGFPRQLGIFCDNLMDGHKRLTQEIHSYNSLAVIQLHHAGMRTPKDLIGGKQPVCPASNSEFDARALSLDEVKTLKDDFVSAAVRSKSCGYDGIEVHGAHGYIIAQFLSSDINYRTDEYGGALANRAKLLFEIVQEIRRKCGSEFKIGVRLSPEKFGMDIAEIKWVIHQLVNQYEVDFIDISLWDSFKIPDDEKYNNKSLLHHFTEIDYKNTKLTVAGKINSAAKVEQVLSSGVDFVAIGRSAILHHDFPVQVINDSSFDTIETPVSREYLRSEGLSDVFIEYLTKWPNFIVD